jgi:1-acyl-sn-glycerol-3-phosphate acyltransferase
MNKSYLIPYPRRVFIRKSMTSIGKVLLFLLADVKIDGKERLPKKGPIILAGNHAAVLEAVMMAVYNPGLVEFVGTGDIPFDPNYAWIANAYGLIPVNRGNLDRKSLHMGLDVLAQGGILGIFPEGGTWDPAQMQAQIGVAWLSYKSQASILPIGFGGVRGSLEQALKLKRPQVQMNVGELIPPVQAPDGTQSLKGHLEVSANHVLNQINALIPQEDLAALRKYVDEEFDLEVEVSSDEELVDIPQERQVPDGVAYAHFLYNPVLIDVLVRNLNLPIKPIKLVYRCSNMEPLIEAWNAILAYLKTNPGFFTYRFGVDEGLSIQRSLNQLRQLGLWVQESGYQLTLTPIRRFRNANTNAQVVERGGCFPKTL